MKGTIKFNDTNRTEIPLCLSAIGKNLDDFAIDNLNKYYWEGRCYYESTPIQDFYTKLRRINDISRSMPIEGNPGHTSRFHEIRLNI